MSNELEEVVEVGLTKGEIIDLNLEYILYLLKDCRESYKRIAMHFGLKETTLRSYLLQKGYTKKKIDRQDGILKYQCQYCGYKVKYKRGRKKSPQLVDVDKWLCNFQCPNCGKKCPG